MAVNCPAKTLFIKEYEGLFKHIFKLLEYDLHKCHDFVIRFNNQMRAVIRYEYLRGAFSDRNEMYLFAITEVIKYYAEPYRLIFQYLD